MALSHMQMSTLERAEPSVSHTAIAAVLARTDLSMGERLVALSLASFANRDERAFPGNAAAAARAGLGRSRYLEAREQLVARGLVAIEEAGRGRGQATTLTACSRSPARGGTARSTRAYWSTCSAAARSVGPRGCCSRRLPRSPTSRARSTSCRPTTSAAPQAWRTAPTAARAPLCSPPARSSSSMTVAGAVA